MRPLRIATSDDHEKMSAAIDHLRRARNLLTKLRVPRAADVVRRALASAEGASRHLDHRIRGS